MPPDPKPPPRIVDPAALRAARLRYDACAACGRRGESIHHVIPRGEGGDDVPGNLLTLCGHGTAGCHGSLHGNTYVVGGERRDAAWVAERIGRHIVARRRDVIEYVESKLGVAPGRAYLERRYLIFA